MVPDTTVVCTDSLWEHSITLSNSSNVDPQVPLAHANQLPLPKLYSTAVHESSRVSSAICSTQTFTFTFTFRGTPSQLGDGHAEHWPCCRVYLPSWWNTVSRHHCSKVWV